MWKGVDVHNGRRDLWVIATRTDISRNTEIRW